MTCVGLSGIGYKNKGDVMSVTPYRNSKKDHESNITRYRLAAGVKVVELADKIGCHQSELSSLINGMSRPFYKKGEIKPHVKRLSAVLHASLAELFPRYICDIERNDEKVGGLLRSQMEGISIGESRDEKTRETISAVKKALAELPERNRDVIYKRFFLDMTFEEIADSYGVSRERIRQIQAKALRLLRHPRMSRELKQCFLNG